MTEPDMPVQMAEGQEQGQSVTITKNPDGTFTVGEHQCKDIEEALMYAKQALGGGDGAMSVQEAFGQGFKGDSVDPVPGMA